MLKMNCKQPVSCWIFVTYPVTLSMRRKGSLSEPPKTTLVSRLGENSILLPVLTLLINIQHPHAFAVHVVPQLHTSSFA